MSWFSKYVYDPIQAALSRAASSSNPAVSGAATQVQKTYQQVSGTISGAANTGISINSAAGLGNDVVAELENGLNAAVDAFLMGALPAAGPVGVALAPEAVAGANVVLTFAEQHALSYVSSLFGSAKAQVAAAGAKAASLPQ